MSKKILIVLFVFALIFVVAGGVRAMTSPKIEHDGLSATTESKPVAKLVYVGTNETLSEALYHLDLKDGKLDGPHIVHTFLDQGPDRPRQKLTFVNQDGSIKKEVILDPKKTKTNTRIDVEISKTGKYAMVTYEYYQDDNRSVRYYDINGNILWDRRNVNELYVISPDGERIAMVKYYYFYEGNEIYPTITLFNARRKKTKEYKVIAPNKTLIYGGIFFSDVGDDILVHIYLSGDNNHKYLFFNKEFKLYFERDIVNLRGGNPCLSFNGSTIVIDGERVLEKDSSGAIKRSEYVKVFLTKNGEDVSKKYASIEKDICGITFSQDNNSAIAELKKGNRRVVKILNFDELSIADVAGYDEYLSDPKYKNFNTFGNGNYSQQYIYYKDRIYILNAIYPIFWLGEFYDSFYKNLAEIKTFGRWLKFIAKRKNVLIMDDFSENELPQGLIYLWKIRE